MEFFMTINLKKLIALTIMLSGSAFSWATNPADEYYADDIFAAIQEAKKRPHHYDYSRSKRYNRSTTQSLDIPRLLNQEMEKTSIDTSAATSITAADTPVSEMSQQEQNIFKVGDESTLANRAAPITTSTPIMGNPNVQAANVTTNVIAR